MKVKNLKTRIAAFGLAGLVGVSTLSSGPDGAGGTGIRTGGYESEREGSYGRRYHERDFG